MPEPLFATLSVSYAFLQNSCCEGAANFSSVLEAVRNGLRRAVDTNRNSIDLRIADSLREHMAGKSNKVQLQTIDNWFLSVAIGTAGTHSGAGLRPICTDSEFPTRSFSKSCATHSPRRRRLKRSHALNEHDLSEKYCDAAGDLGSSGIWIR